MSVDMEEEDMCQQGEREGEVYSQIIRSDVRRQEKGCCWSY